MIGVVGVCEVWLSCVFKVVFFVEIVLIVC